MSTQYDSRTADKFVVRLPDGMRDDVQGAADYMDTSMNTVFIQAVRQYLDTQQRQKLLLDALSLAVTRKVPPCVEQLQRDLTVADERADHNARVSAIAVEDVLLLQSRVDVLEELLRTVIDSGELCTGSSRGLEIEADICAALKPAEGGGECYHGYASLLECPQCGEPYQ